MLIKAVQLSKEGKAKEAANLLAECTVEENELSMKLACVQLLLNQDEKQEAIKVLENLNDKDKSLPGIVGALVTLYMANNDREKASKAFRNAIDYHKRNKVSWKQSSSFLNLKIINFFREPLITLAIYGVKRLIFIYETEKLK